MTMVLSPRSLKASWEGRQEEKTWRTAACVTCTQTPRWTPTSKVARVTDRRVGQDRKGLPWDGRRRDSMERQQMHVHAHFWVEVVMVLVVVAGLWMVS
jgi:hypothetical protein